MSELLSTSACVEELSNMYVELLEKFRAKEIYMIIHIFYIIIYSNFQSVVVMIVYSGPGVSRCHVVYSASGHST